MPSYVSTKQSAITCNGKGSVPDPLVCCQGTLFQFRRESFREATVSDGEDGAKPSRCRHCKRGVILQYATVRFGAWEGAGKRRSASQETQLMDVSIQPFESKGG